MVQAVSLSFFRFSGLRDRVWAFTMMGFARLPLMLMRDVGFWKLCGSGTGEGFTPVPDTKVVCILATWPDAETARRRVTGAGLFAYYRARAAEHWTVFLTPTSARGRWSGRTPFEPGEAKTAGPLAALTRATIRPSTIARFWRRVPSISDVIGQDRSVLFKTGIGEIPWLHQGTFSVWPDADSMARFARRGDHAAAIRAVRSEGWFREELYARFVVHSDIGTWNGASPLANPEAP